ncbi:homing endonuclease [Escherichia phage UPEC07]|nr:homing endonuclease [Escherichia phage UPEC07]
MNYLKHYNNLIQRAKNRAPIDGYKEKHHIIPRCMGGLDTDENLVELTAPEHFVAHLLLVKIYPDNHSLAHAAKILMGSNNYNNKQFEWVRIRAVETSIKFHTGRKRSKQTCENISKALKGKKYGPRSEEHCKKLSEAAKGKKFSEEHCKKLSERVFTDDWRAKISKANKERVLVNHSEKIKQGITDDVRKRLSELNKNAPRHTCEHCGKITNPGNYKRWHGENCKVLKNGVLREV